MLIHVNIFTNCCGRYDLIDRTLESFEATFGQYEYTVYVDSHPKTHEFSEYHDKLKSRFRHVVETGGLADGYIASVKKAQSAYLFQLEHDWLFAGPIKHSLEQLCDIMARDGLYHLRFNKRTNRAGKWDRFLEDHSEYCVTPCLSNNPHLIDVARYREVALPLLRRRAGNKGVESELSKPTVLRGAIYGPVGYPATVRHIGR